MHRRPAQVLAFLSPPTRRARPAVIVTAFASLALGACAGGPGSPFELAQAAPETTVAADTGAPKTELQKATEYWGQQVAKNPKDAQAAINYARNLKAIGAKPQALAVLEQAHSVNPTNKTLNSEYRTSGARK